MGRLFLSIFLILSFFLLSPLTKVQAQSTQTIQTTVGTPVGDGGGGSSAGNIHFYCQYGKVNESGVRTVYQYWNTSGCNISGYGCGPTSTAMIMTTFGVTKTPTEVALNTHREGCGGDNGGLTAGEIQNYVAPYLKRNGFTITGNLVSSGNINVGAAKRYLDSGYIILGGGLVRYISGGNYKLGGHAFVVSGYKNTPEDSFDAYDPTFCSSAHPGGQRPLYDVNNSGLNGNNNVETWYYAYAIKKL
jgi:hypothetical protein